MPSKPLQVRSVSPLFPADFFLIPAGNAATVQDDSAVDSLFGGTDRDWFLPDGIDNILDTMLGDVLTTVGP